MTYPRALRLLAATAALALVPAVTAGPSAPVRTAAAPGEAGGMAGPPPGGERASRAERADLPGTARAAAAGLERPPAPAGGAPRIHDVQGRALESPMTGREVTGLTGVVTASTATGFWMQDPVPDGDPATSEGIFVFSRTRPAVSPGDQVRVTGRVSEYRPGGADSMDLGRTEVDATRVEVTEHGVALPQPVVIGPGGRLAPSEVIDKDRRFDPARDGLDFYESLEGMLVAVDDAVVAGPRSPYGEITVLPAGGAGASVRTTRGGILQRPADADPERIMIDDLLASVPPADVGDRLPGRVTGVIDYGFGDFRLLPTSTPRIVKGGLAPESTRPQRPDELAIATADLDNLDPSDPPERFTWHAHEIVDRLRSPDIVVVQKLQDNSGADDDGTVAADQTVAQLIAAISAAGGPAYDWRSIDPDDNADGGEPGGNIRVGFLFRTDRGLEFTDRPGGEADAADPAAPAAPATAAATAVDDGTGHPRLTLSPGRVNPAAPAWTDVRKPLAGEFGWKGGAVFVIANHWTEPGGDDPLYGRRQPPQRPSERQRTAQARVVADFVNSLLAIDRDARVVVAGNLNDDEASQPLRTLTGDTGLVDLPARLPAPDRYTSVVTGNARLLDHILVSPSLAALPHEVDIVHTTAEFADRAGGRDPSVVRLTMK